MTNSPQKYPHLSKYDRVIPPVRGGLFYRWGMQAYIDLVFLKVVLSYIDHLVPRTFLQIIKLCAESRDEVEELYGEILNKREIARLYDSPRERWRKRYGNFVREMEWACCELKKYFTKDAYEELVINTASDFFRDALTGVGPFMARVLGKDKERKEKRSCRVREMLNRFYGRLLTKTFNLGGWVVGEVELEEFDLQKRVIGLRAVDCAWLRAPGMRELPEESCLLICKGACEKAFGLYGPFRATLEPHLPETSCEVKMFW